MEEQHFSQRISQLSTNETNNKDVLLPSMKEMNMEIVKIPHYLTKRNESFQGILSQAVATMNTTKSNATDTLEELRKIAVLIYQTMVIQIYHFLSTAYFKSGLGQLIIPSPKPS